MKQKKDNTEKRPYEKPRLRIIDLAAEEVLAVGCKVINGSNAFGNAGPSCTFPRQCLAPGS